MAWGLAAAGVALMVWSALWAPPQPELWQDGGACEVALCGTLEDPSRWRTAWWAWSGGAVALLVAVPILARPARLRVVWVAVVLMTAPLWLLGLAVLAYAASLSTSVQGAATVAVCALLAPLAAVVTGAAKLRRAPSA